jgi:hypothetical protein
MIFGAIGGMKFGRGNRSTRRKPTPAPLCPPQNPTWQTRSRTLDRSGGKPATNRLSYGAALFSPILSPLTTRRFTVEVFDPASTWVQVDMPLLQQNDPQDRHQDPQAEAKYGNKSTVFKEPVQCATLCSYAKFEPNQAIVLVYKRGPMMVYLSSSPRVCRNGHGQCYSFPHM